MTDELGVSNVLCLRMDSFDAPLIPTAEWLEGKVGQLLEHADASRRACVLLDEIQEGEGWEKVVRRPHTQRGVDVYLTGSNAHVLSSDLATLLGGRYVEMRVLPLSFAEYLDFAEAAGISFDGREEAFAEYVRCGGMPAQFELPRRDGDTLPKLLSTVYETIILNDVALHSGISDLGLLAKLVRFVFSTSGSLFSTRNVASALASAGRRTTPDTIDNYLRDLEASYVVSACEQAGLAVKRVLRPLRKYYPVDTGLERSDYYDVPPVALREALVNSVAHREYALSGPTLVSVMPDGVEIVSPGGLPLGLEEQDLSAHVSVPRNKALANVLFRLEIIEAYGTGLGRIRASYAGSGVEPRIRLTPNTFTVFLPNRNAPGARSAANAGVAASADSGTEELLGFLASGPKSRREVQEELGVSQSSAIRLLSDLVGRGLVERRGAGRSTRYALSGRGAGLLRE